MHKHYQKYTDSCCQWASQGLEVRARDWLLLRRMTCGIDNDPPVRPRRPKATERLNEHPCVEVSIWRRHMCAVPPAND
jgi:hypothetical protein